MTKENKVRMPEENDALEYFTQRSIYKRGDPRKKNWGTTKHKVKVWVFKDEPNTANVTYVCPYCDNEGRKQEPYKEPFKFKCDECDKTIRVPKLDKRLKKKKKKKKAKKKN